MEQELKIVEHYKTEFNSSPIEISSEKVSFIIEHECTCDKCGTDIFELCDFPEIDIDKEELLCEDCHRGEYLSVCAVCDDYFEKPDSPEETRFIVSKENSTEAGVEPGLYQAVSFPMFYGSCLSGFDAFFEDRIKLVRSIDINSIQRELYGKEIEPVSCDYICPDCYDRLSVDNNLPPPINPTK